MKPIKALSILALVAGLTAPAHAEPTPANAPQGQIMAGPGDGAAGPLTAKSVTTVQSPRDPASGQATGTPPQSMIFTNDTIDKLELSVAKIQSPRDPASGLSGNAQTTDGFKSVEGLSSETEFIGKNPGTGDQFLSGGSHGQGIRRQQPAPENVGQFAESGKKGEELMVQPNPQGDARTYREGGVNDTTHRTKKPRRNSNGTRERRMQKP
jgi:hypothetical protein